MNSRWIQIYQMISLISECTSWESISTKQKHFVPGGFPFTRRTFLSSKYAKGSKALRIVSTVVVGFTFFIIMAVKQHGKKWLEKSKWRLVAFFFLLRDMKNKELKSTYFCCLWIQSLIGVSLDEEGCGCPKILPVGLFPAVGAAGPPAAAKPLESGQSYAPTGPAL